MQQILQWLITEKVNIKLANTVRLTEQKRLVPYWLDVAPQSIDQEAHINTSAWQNMQCKHFYDFFGKGGCQPNLLSRRVGHGCSSSAYSPAPRRPAPLNAEATLFSSFLLMPPSKHIRFPWFRDSKLSRSRAKTSQSPLRPCTSTPGLHRKACWEFWVTLLQLPQSEMNWASLIFQFTIFHVQYNK